MLQDPSPRTDRSLEGSVNLFAVLLPAIYVLKSETGRNSTYVLDIMPIDDMIDAVPIAGRPLVALRTCAS